MAIVNQVTGEYLKVVGTYTDFQQKLYYINYFIFANAEQRQRFESGLSPYEVFKSGQYNGIGHIENAIALLPDATKSVKDAILTACYSALKNDMFSDWVDG